MRLVRTLADSSRLVGTIVETEAYLGTVDRAAHTFGGRRTRRVESMYLPGGHAYVYTIHGQHCLNITSRTRDVPEAVLIRALDPIDGVEAMRERRTESSRSSKKIVDVQLCSGPGKLCSALGITRDLDSHDVVAVGPLYVEQTPGAPVSLAQIASGPRVGVGSAGEWADKPLRFCLRGNPHVSRPRL